MREREDDLMADAADDNIENMYLTFQVEQETFAVNIGCVTEIVGMQRISAIPDVPRYIKGAMNLRGKVIPVMDQRLRFGLPASEYDDRTTIIVLEVAGVLTGLIVDKVTDVVTIPKENIDPPPHWMDQGKEGVVSGLGKLDDSLSIILEVSHLLYDEAVGVDLSQAVAPASAANSLG
jgi:purine-binding chemotaxis protein CheW